MAITEREVVVSPLTTRGAEGMTSAYSSAWLRLATLRFASRVTIRYKGREAIVGPTLSFMNGFEGNILEGERVVVRAEGEDAEEAGGFLSEVIAGERKISSAWREEAPLALHSRMEDKSIAE